MARDRERQSNARTIAWEDRERIRVDARGRALRTGAWTGVITGLVLASADVADITSTTDDRVLLLDLIWRSSFPAWTIGTGIVVGFLAITGWERELTRRALRAEPSDRSLTFVIGVALCLVLSVVMPWAWGWGTPWGAEDYLRETRVGTNVLVGACLVVFPGTWMAAHGLSRVAAHVWYQPGRSGATR